MRHYIVTSVLVSWSRLPLPHTALFCSPSDNRSPLPPGCVSLSPGCAILNPENFLSDPDSGKTALRRAARIAFSLSLGLSRPLKELLWSTGKVRYAQFILSWMFRAIVSPWPGKAGRLRGQAPRRVLRLCLSGRLPVLGIYARCPAVCPAGRSDLQARNGFSVAQNGKQNAFHSWPGFYFETVPRNVESFQLNKIKFCYT